MKGAVAKRAIPVLAQDSIEAEIIAVRKAIAWAPVTLILTDCEAAIQQHRIDGIVVRYVNGHPLHYLAHRLSRQASGSVGRATIRV